MKHMEQTMSIDIQTESLVRFHEAGKLFPGNPSRETLRRWRNKGVRGAKLETVRIGCLVWTSREAVARFLTAINTEPCETRKLTPSQRLRSGLAAMHQLAEIL